MSKKPIRSTLSLLTTVMLSISLLCAGEGSGITWLDDYKTTLNKAGELNRLVMVEFYTSWCLYCGKLEKETMGDPRVVEMAGDFVCARLDADVQKAAATRYQPEGYPTVVFATSSGEEIVKISGFRAADPFVKVMRTVKKRGPEIAGFMARIEDNPKDFEARKELGSIFLDLGLGGKAEEHLMVAAKNKNMTADEDCAIQFLLGRAAAEEENYRRACKIFQRLIDNDPHGSHIAEYYLEMGRAYLNAGQENKAKKIFAEIASRFPGTPQAEVAGRL